MKQIGGPQGLSTNGSGQADIWKLLSDCHADRGARGMKLHLGGKNIRTLAHQASGQAQRNVLRWRELIDVEWLHLPRGGRTPGEHRERVIGLIELLVQGW